MAFFRNSLLENAKAADRWLPPAAMALAVLLYAVVHHAHPSRPTTSAVPDGWFAWVDAGKYLRSALAWSRFDLRATEHWYPAGYPILGAIARPLTPTQPFYIPDALCLAASLWLFAALSAEISGLRPGARAWGAAVFFATTCLNITLLEIWVLPWTTTPATVGIYACLLATLRYMAHPRPFCALRAGLSGGAIMLFRPTESALMLGCAALGMMWAFLHHRVAPARILRAVAAAAGGAALGVCAFLSSEWATGGFGPSGYLAQSALLGFEWRLIPLHWVEVFGDPRPLWPNEHGIVLVFPWIIPGVAGLAAALVATRSEMLARHSLLIGATVLHCAVFLAYRDMHPSQVWWIYLYHYFKWVLPVLGLYAAFLPMFLLGQRRVFAFAAGLTAVALLFPWRPELVVDAAKAHPALRLNDHQILLPDGLPDITSAVLVPARGDFDAVFHTEHAMMAEGRRWRVPYDLRAFVQPQGLLLTPLRPLPAVPSVVTFGPRLILDPDTPPMTARQRIRFGVPCWLRPLTSVCDPGPLIPGPPLRVGDAVDAAVNEPPIFADGWGDPEPAGRWTIGQRATLEARIPGLAGGGVTLAMTGRGYTSRRMPAPSTIRVYANGDLVAIWRPTMGETTLQARIPGERLGPDGRLWIRFIIDAPSAPAWPWEDGDHRALGLFVRSIRIDPLPAPKDGS